MFSYSKRTMYKIKQIPEDFIVNEIMPLKFETNGKNTFIQLKKKEYTLQKAISTIADILQIPENLFKYAGTKDKIGITTQTICVLKKIDKERIDKINLQDIELKFLGYSDKRINLGDLSKNEFIITIRNLEQNQEIQNLNSYINYFDTQRFGRDLNNHIIGKLLIKKQFKKAVQTILKTDSKDYEQILESERDYLNKKILEHLINTQNDFVGALKKLPKKIVTMYIHALQSDIWNKAVSIYLEKFEHTSINTEIGILNFAANTKDIKIPLVGFDVECDEQIEEIIENIMEQENVTYRDFIIREFPEISSAGEYRNINSKIYDLYIQEKQPDDLNENKYKITVSFKLDKGCYATMAIRNLIQ